MSPAPAGTLTLSQAGFGPGVTRVVLPRVSGIEWGSGRAPGGTSGRRRIGALRRERKKHFA